MNICIEARLGLLSEIGKRLSGYENVVVYLEKINESISGYQFVFRVAIGEMNGRMNVTFKYSTRHFQSKFIILKEETI